MKLIYKNENGKLVQLHINKNSFLDYYVLRDYITLSFGTECTIGRKETFYKWNFSVNVMQIENYKELIEYLENIKIERIKIINQ